MKEKIGILVLTVILLTSLVSGINLDISSKPVSNSVILDLNEPAVFDLTIRNLGENDTFEIYSLVGIDILPNESFNLNSGETKTLRIQVIPQESLMFKRELPFHFDYKIKNSRNEIQEEALNIRITDLASSFDIDSGNINPESETISVSIKNELMFNFEQISVILTSAFFDYEETFSLSSLQTKNIQVPLDKDKLSKLNAGRYLMNAELTVRNKKANFESQLLFLEQSGIEPTETSEGVFIQRTEFTRKNVGNIKKTVEINHEQNLFAYLFTDTNTEPSFTKITGFAAMRTWEKELIPNEEYNVVITTNWYYPILIIILVVIIIFIIAKTIETDISLRKHVSFVKTKGGQFALKISLHLRSKKFLERILNSFTLWINIRIISSIIIILFLYSFFITNNIFN